MHMFLSRILSLALFFMHLGCSHTVDRTKEISQELLVGSNDFKSATIYEITLPSNKIETRGHEIISLRDLENGDQIRIIEKGVEKKWYLNEKFIGFGHDLTFIDNKPILLPSESENTVPRQFFRGTSIVGTKNTESGFVFFIEDLFLPPSVHLTVIEQKYMMYQSPFFETFLSEIPMPISIPEPFEAVQLKLDGIPITILKSKSTTLPSPTLVSLYGSYGEIHREFYSPILLAALKKGLVRVLIHVRGGSELGFKHYKEKLNDPRVSSQDLNKALKLLYQKGLLLPQTTSLIAKSAGAVPVFLANPDVRQIFLRSPLLDLVRSTTDPNIPQYEREAFEWNYQAKELSPNNQPSLKAPLYIFHQEQDNITPISDTLRFLESHPGKLFTADGDHLRASNDVIERRWTAEILARSLISLRSTND